MTSNKVLTLGLVVVLLLIGFVASTHHYTNELPTEVYAAPAPVESWTQTLVTDVGGAGPTTSGNGVLQTGEVSNLSAAVATTTLTQVYATPSVGSLYVRGVFLETATNTTGKVELKYGTGSNCASGTTTFLTLGPSTGSSPLNVGYYPVNARPPAGKALCVDTDATTTSARVLGE